MTTETCLEGAGSVAQSNWLSTLSVVDIVGGLVGWFCVWPAVFFGTFLPVTTGHHLTDLEVWLPGGGSVLWFLSCALVLGLLLGIIQQSLRSPSPRWLIVGWTVGWLLCGLSIFISLPWLNILTGWTCGSLF